MLRHRRVRFYIGFSRERTFRGKRFVSASLAASLAAPEGVADVTNTESHRFRQPPLGKATDAPRSEHVVWTQWQKFSKAFNRRVAAVLTT